MYDGIFKKLQTKNKKNKNKQVFFFIILFLAQADWSD